MDDDTAAGIIKLRKEMPNTTLPMLIRVAEERKIIQPGTALSKSTMYRFLKANGLMDQPAPSKDRRRFEAESPNDLWQSDVMHGPMVIVDGKQRKTYLTAFIDDHSRLIPHAEFFLSEKLDNFLEAFRKALLTRGFPRKPAAEDIRVLPLLGWRADLLPNSKLLVHMPETRHHCDRSLDAFV